MRGGGVVKFAPQLLISQPATPVQPSPSPQILVSVRLALSFVSWTAISLTTPVRSQFGAQSSSTQLLSLPFLPHNLQPSGFSVQKSLGSSPIHMLRPGHVLSNSNCLWSVRILKR